MKKMFKVLLFPIWLVLEIVVFVLKLMMVLSSTVLGDSFADSHPDGVCGDAAVRPKWVDAAGTCVVD